MLDESLKSEFVKFQDVLANLAEETREELVVVTARIDELNTLLQSEEMHADRSENASFEIAKDERDTKVTIQALKQKRLTTIETEAGGEYVPLGFIQLGSIVELTLLSISGDAPDQKKNTKFIIKLVSHEIGKPKVGLVAIDSKVGTALLQHKAGDIIETSAPKGKVKYKIERIY